MGNSDAKRELPPVPEPLPTPLVDAHTHMDACGAEGAGDVRAMVDRAERGGVGRVVTVADDLDAARWAVRAADWDERVFAAVALHPTRAKDLGEAEREVLAGLVEHPRVVAVGETGLDYFWDRTEPAAQQEHFRRHIALAKRAGKPLMIHDRDAHADVLRILREEGAPDRVVFHAFSGDAAMARECAASGYVLSFPGVITFKNAPALRAAAAATPLAQVLVETDAPFLTPHPLRGRPNAPHLLPLTVRGLAAAGGHDLDEVCATIRATGARIFGLPTG